MDLCFVFGRKSSFDILQILLVYVVEVVLGLEELRYIGATQRTTGAVVEVLLHALDTEAVPAGQDTGLDHQIEAHATVFFGLLELLLIEVLQGLIDVFHRLLAVLCGILHIVFVSHRSSGHQRLILRLFFLYGLIRINSDDPGFKIGIKVDHLNLGPLAVMMALALPLFEQLLLH